MNLVSYPCLIRSQTQWVQNQELHTNIIKLINLNNTNEPVDFVLSPSEGSLPNGKIVGNIIHNYKDSGSIDGLSKHINGDKNIVVPVHNPFHHSNNSVEMPLERAPFTEISQGSKSKCYYCLICIFNNNL